MRCLEFLGEEGTQGRHAKVRVAQLLSRDTKNFNTESWKSKGGFLPEASVIRSPALTLHL